jgi:uncharacterized protein YcbK (DUF882 family)
MKISKHFSREEFACKCGCGFAVVDVKLLEVLEAVREYFDQPVTITSACRCDNHNKSVGGSDNSKHKLGIAADIIVKDTQAELVQSFLYHHVPYSCGIGAYKKFTHIDVRNDAARWKE